MGGPPQISVPEIFVENPDEQIESASNEGTLPRDFTESAPVTPARGVQRESSLSGHTPGRMSPTDTSLQRGGSGSNSPIGLGYSPSASPNLAPQRLEFVDTSYRGAEAGRGSETSSQFDPSHNRTGSSISALGVLDSLDNSAWGESIRRSFTMRRPNSSSQP